MKDATRSGCILSFNRFSFYLLLFMHLGWSKHQAHLDMQKLAVLVLICNQHSLAHDLQSFFEVEYATRI